MWQMGVGMVDFFTLFRMENVQQLSEEITH